MVKNREGNLDERQLKQLHVIRRNSRMLAMLISDLLDLSRIDSGNFRIVTAEFDVSQLITDVSENFRPTYADNGQTLAAKLPPAGSIVVADRDRIGQVLGNLLSNSSKYSPKGAEVALEASLDEDRLNVSVSDHGVGISLEDMPRLFMLFFRADNEATRSVPGSGIGLYIARQIIEMHGGEITAESTPGKGTTFRFWIPRNGPARPAPPK
jgi:signal transduction histidine kinase